MFLASNSKKRQLFTIFLIAQSAVIVGCQKGLFGKSHHKKQPLNERLDASTSESDSKLVNYVVGFETLEEANTHRSEVVATGGQIKQLDDSGKVLEATVNPENLDKLDVSEKTAVLANVSWQTKHRNNSDFAAEPDFAQNLVTTRKETGVAALLNRFPEADGRGTTVAVLDTGIEFGADGISTFADGTPKVRGFYDLTNFGQTSLVPIIDTSVANEVEVEGKKILISDVSSIKKILAKGSLSEETQAKEMREPAGVDLNGNDSSNDVFPFMLVEKIDGTKAIWIDADLDGKVSGTKSDELTDFNTTHVSVDLKKSKIGSGNALAVTLTSDSQVQFHTILGGHGTSCAAIIAGEKYLDGKIDGMAPKANLLGYALDATGRDIYSSSTLLKMFLSAKDNGADAISVSWGFSTADLKSAQNFAAILDREIASKGIVIGIAAGNEGPGSSSASQDDYIPRLGFGLGAAITEVQAKNVYNWLGVEGTNVIHYSSVGPTRGGRPMPDLVSPLMTLVRGERNGGSSQYQPFGGTSSATPAFVGSVTALLSVLKAQGHPIDMALLKSALLTSAAPLKDVPAIRQGTGLVNVNAAYDIYIKALQESDSNQSPISVIVPTISLNGRMIGEGIISKSFEKSALVSLSFDSNLSGLNTTKDAFQEQLKIETKAPWISTPQIVSIQGSGGKFPVSFDSAIAKKPGIYADEIRLIDSQGNIRVRIPVRLEIPFAAESNGLVWSWSGVLEPFLIKSTPISLNKAGNLDLTGSILGSRDFVSGRVVLSITNQDGFVIDKTQVSLDGPIGSIKWQTKELPAGQYELQIFQTVSSIVQPLQVNLGVELGAYKLISEVEGGKLKVVIENNRARPVSKATLRILGRKAEIDLLPKTDSPFPVYAGLWKFQEDELRNTWQTSIFQNDVARKVTPFLTLATSFLDTTTKKTWSWDWYPVTAKNNPSYISADLESDASELVSIESYPNVGEWERIKDVQIKAQVRSIFASPIVIEKSRSSELKLNWLIEDFDLPTMENHLYGEIELYNGETSVATLPVPLQ